MPDDVSPAADPRRIEHDSLGPVSVPAGRLWGAQTQRALEHFARGGEAMPPAVVRALAQIKIAAARANAELGLLPAALARLVEAAAAEVASGALDGHFPLSIWQSGSGTQTNMNVNEVVANRAAQLAGAEPGRKDPVHPNDHVNLGQSTNDAFPTAMHMAAVQALEQELLPALETLAQALDAKAGAFAAVVKIGRTHLQDAVPLTLGQEFSGYAAQVAAAARGVRAGAQALLPVPLGGTAVGTGLGAHPRFAGLAVGHLRALTGRAFTPAPNRFALMAAHDGLVAASGAVRTAAVALMKIANDVRWLGSGPRCGLGELLLPANEPGSSIMPGKVNPTQCEALTMACAYALGLDAGLAVAGSQGNFELNVYKPLLIHNLLAMTSALAGTVDGFTRLCVAGIEADRERIAATVDKSLMLVTALVPAIGYDMAARVALLAHARGGTLREACLELGCLDAERFDALMDPAGMIPATSPHG